MARRRSFRPRKPKKYADGDRDDDDDEPDEDEASKTGARGAVE